MDTQKIGKFIAVKRKEKHLTQAQLAEELGVTNKTVSRWENGNYMPDLSLLIPLSEQLGISLNELLHGESLSHEEAAEKSEQAIADTIAYSEEKIGRLKRRYLFLVVGTIVGIVAAIFLLDRMLFAEASYQKGDTTQWEAFFPNHSAYGMGMTERGKPVFTNPNKALEKAKSDYSDAIEAMQEEYHLLPFSKYTYKWYITYSTAWHAENEMVMGQLESFRVFLDIYEDSFVWKTPFWGEKAKWQREGDVGMAYIQVSLLMIVGGMFLLAVTLCTQGRDCWHYFIYQGRAKASVQDVRKFSVTMSRRMVEKQTGETAYEPILATQDKSVHYFPYVFGKKMQAVLSWNAEGDNWRAYYPYLRENDGWKMGEEMELHYSRKHPWRYAICDNRMWIMLVVKCAVYIGISVGGWMVFMGSL